MQAQDKNNLISLTQVIAKGRRLNFLSEVNWWFSDNIYVQYLPHRTDKLFPLLGETLGYWCNNTIQSKH